MKIAIIGGGITGLTAAYELSKRGHQVTIFEKEKALGGLAGGFKKKGWSWHLESAYHHLFTNDDAILSLMKKLGLENTLMLTRPITANYVNMSARGGFSIYESERKKNFRRSLPSLILSWILDGKTIASSDRKNFVSLSEIPHADQSAQILSFDSPLHLFRYPALSFTAKIRTATLLAFLKLNPFWQPLESVTAEKLIRTIGGNEAWKKLWEPLLIAKFGTYARSVAASWFWARIKKRTPKLYYIEGGFHTLIAALEKAIVKHGGIIHTGIQLDQLVELDKFDLFDRVLLTVPTPVAAKLLSGCKLSAVSCQPFSSIPHLHAQTVILETKEPIINHVYWLNIMDRSFPFLAVVAHTNMIDKKHYGNRHITYIANYLPDGHRYLSMSADDLYREFLPFIKRLNPSCHVFPPGGITCHVFVGPFAQPVHELHYSRRAPTLQTTIPGIYLANLDSIYPWDRGTNYAVELGQRAARALSSQI